MIDSERLVKNFCAYARTDSESFDEGAMEERLVADLKALGCEVRTDDAGSKTGSTGNNIYAFYKGTLPGEPLIYSCHMDTVAPGKASPPSSKTASFPAAATRSSPPTTRRASPASSRR